MNLSLLWLVPLLPLAAAAINGLVGQKMGRAFTSALGVGSVWASFLVSVYYLILYTGSHSGPTMTAAPFEWFDAGSFKLSINLLLDPLSLVMILIVTGVGALIHTYSMGYMADDAGYNRYFCYLNLFTFSMLMLVMGDSFLVLFVGWELVGLCSYLLIGFWYDRQSATDAGKKAFIVNRVGDWAFVIGIILTAVLFLPLVPSSGGLQFHAVFSYLQDHAIGGTLPPSLDMIPVIALLLFIGATGKSAQLPILYIWLPDAMEGPTPVSALIHAATMVTAGVYMVCRCHPFFLMSPDVMTIIAWVGAITALVAALTAMVQTDIKRVLAYSTISQIGYMFIGAGVGAFANSIFHLMTHAFFKALLFLGAGAVIHALHNEQDMRKMGGLQKRIPQIGVLMGIGVLAIAGCPGLSGFWSKDYILVRAAGVSFGLWAVGTVTSFLTAFYMTRLWLMTFHGEEHWTGPAHESDGADAHGHTGPADIHPTPATMTIPMAVLALLSVVGGAAWFFLPGFLSPVFESMERITGRGLEGQAFAPEAVLMGIAIVMFLLGVGAAWAMYGRDNREPKPWMLQHPHTLDMLFRGFFIDRGAHLFFGDGGMRLARTAYDDVEVRTIDRGVVGGVGRGVQRLSHGLRHVQSGSAGDYALAMGFGAACFVVYFLLR